MEKKIIHNLREYSPLPIRYQANQGSAIFRMRAIACCRCCPNVEQLPFRMLNPSSSPLQKKRCSCAMSGYLLRPEHSMGIKEPLWST